MSARLTSRCASLARGLVALLVCAGVASVARAQPGAPSALARDCDVALVHGLAAGDIGAAWAAHHPDSVLARTATFLGRDQYATAMGVVLADARLAVAAAPDSLARRYRARLDALDRAFAALLARSAGERARFLADSVQPALWQLDEVPGADGASYYPVFAGTPDEIDVDSTLPRDTRRALCWPAIAIHRLLTLYGAPRRASTVAALDALAARWESYVDHSYSQLPWELALNGLGRPRRSWEPPRHQWIVVHPSVGVEANGTVAKELRRLDVAVVELLGFVRYDRDYAHYAGLSGVATLASRQNAAVGVYAHLWYPQAKLGYVWRSSPERKRRRGVLVSVDLYGFLTGAPDALRRARDQALGRQLLDRGSGT